MYSDLTALAYEAALLPDRWTNFLDAAASKATAVGGTLFAIDHPSHFNVISGSLDEAWEDFVTGEWGSKNIRAAKVLASGEFHFMHDDQLVSEEEKAASEWYTVFCRRWQLGGSLGTVIPLPSGGKLLMTLERHRSTGAYSQTDVDNFNGVRGDIGRALLLASELAAKDYRSTTQLLQSLGIAAGVVSHRRRLLAANSLFERLIPRVVADRQAGMQFSASAANRLFSEALDRVKPENWGGVVASFPVRGEGDLLPSIAHVLPVRGNVHDLITGGAALVVIYGPNQTAIPSQDLIRQLFDLTPAEAKVASRLVQNSGSYQLAADSLGLSMETVRTQAKSVLRKTGVDSMPGLIRVISNLRLTEEE